MYFKLKIKNYHLHTILKHSEVFSPFLIVIRFELPAISNRTTKAVI